MQARKKTSTWFTTRGLQLPKVVQTIIDANNSISNPSEKSNLSDEKTSNSLRSVSERMKPRRGIKKIAGSENPLVGARYDSGAADAVESADGKEVKM